MGSTLVPCLGWLEASLVPTPHTISLRPSPGGHFFNCHSNSSVTHECLDLNHFSLFLSPLSQLLSCELPDNYKCVDSESQTLANNFHFSPLFLPQLVTCESPDKPPLHCKHSNTLKLQSPHQQHDHHTNTNIRIVSHSLSPFSVKSHLFTVFMHSRTAFEGGCVL